MTIDKKREIKRYSAGIMTAAALLAAAAPAYADTEMPAGRGMNRTNRFESLVENGTISQSAYESIQDYMAANQPEERTGFLSEAVADGIIDQETADKLQEYMQSKATERKTSEDDTAKSGKGRHEDMWNTMLTEGVITQDEYDAIIASMPQRTVDSPNSTQ